MSLEGDVVQKNVKINDELQSKLEMLTEVSELTESEIIRLGILLAENEIKSTPVKCLAQKHRTRNFLANRKQIRPDYFDDHVFQ